MGHIAQRLMPEEAKIAIREDLRAYCARFASMEQAANTLKNVGASTLRNVLNPNFANISDEMWRTVAAQIGYDPRAWAVVETRGYRRMSMTLSDAQQPIA